MTKPPGSSAPRRKTSRAASSTAQGGGIGYELGDIGNDLFLAGIDLDCCLRDGTLAPWAAAILDLADSYAEISPSGSGVKVFFYLAAEDVRCFLDLIGVPATGWGCRRGVPGEDARDHGPAIEVYCKARYFAVTETAGPARRTGCGCSIATTSSGSPGWCRRQTAAGTGKTGRGDNSRSAAAFRMGAPCAAPARPSRRWSRRCAPTPRPPTGAATRARPTAGGS